MFPFYLQQYPVLYYLDILVELTEPSLSSPAEVEEKLTAAETKITDLEAAQAFFDGDLEHS